MHQKVVLAVALALAGVSHALPKDAKSSSSSSSSKASATASATDASGPKESGDTEFVFVDYSGKLNAQDQKITRHDGSEPGNTQTSDSKEDGSDDGTENKKYDDSSTNQKRSEDSLNELEARGDPGKISSCGDNWCPVNDFTTNGRFYVGYHSTVQAFCTHITSDYDGQPAVVGPGAYTGTTISTTVGGASVGLDQGKDPSKYGTPGHIEFEIHNKQSSGDHTPKYDDCVVYMMQMAQPGQSCYGKKNKDTKGGTFNVPGSNNEITYHALPAFGSGD